MRDLQCGGHSVADSKIGEENSSSRSLLGLRVLIVEDSWLVADTLAVQLEERGARVQGPFSTVARTLEFLKTNDADFALVDLNLIDGFADKVIEVLVARNVPYAILTGYRALPTNVDEAAVAFLKKPFDMAELIDILSRYAVDRRST